MSIPAVGTDSIPMSKGAAFLPSLSLAGLCFNQLCELWLLDSAFPLVTVCLCVCEGVCDSVLNMPLLVVTSIKRGGKRLSLSRCFTFCLLVVCEFFFATFFFNLKVAPENPKLGSHHHNARHSRVKYFRVFLFLFFSWSYLFECFYFQFSVKYFSAAKEIFGRIIITFQCVYFRECVCV